jgi:SEC-C motif-containing protein
MPLVTRASRCPCLSGESYGACCEPFHLRSEPAPTATRLMRSRYSAFVVLDASYLLATWHPATRPDTLELDASLRWFRLDILGSTGGGLLDDTGTVEFEAHCRDGATAILQHENSRFSRVDDAWRYVDDVRALRTPSRRER